MQTFRGRFALSCGIMLGVLGYGAPTPAEDDAADITVEEITVVGTRSKERSASDLAVPVDVLEASELLRQGASRTDSLLTRVVPSLNVSQEPISDEATFIRPMTLRGLPPDSTLVLLNGKRRHRSSVISLAPSGGTKGAHGVDVSSIPAIALDRVEVLRDGAAAQYGSDAIAGIVNLVMRGAPSGVHVETRYGQYYAGDGDDLTVAGSVGLPLTNNGFLNVSGEVNQSDATNRSIQIRHAELQAAAGNTEIPDPAQLWGNPDIDGNVKIFANAGFDVGDAHEAYAFGGTASRTVTGGYYWRDPLNRSGVFTVGWPYLWGFEPNEPGTALVFDHTPLDGVDCPAIEGFIADSRIDPAQLAAVNADPNCFAFRSIFPAGFRPKFGGAVEDRSMAFGVRGELPGGLTYDVSAVYGKHAIDYTLDDTVNPQLASLEAAIPTSYALGGRTQEDWTLNLDLSRQLDMAAFHSPLNVAFGAEYRREEYGTSPGEPNSWLIDFVHADGTDFDESSIDLAAVGCEDPAYVDFLEKIASGELVGRYSDDAGVGSNGAPGLRPDPCSPDTSDRSTVAGYLDVEGQVSERVLVGAAARYEAPDGFDSNLDGKLAARLQVADAVAVRGSVGTGFRVPTVGQENLRVVSTILTGGMLVDELTVPRAHPLLSGAEPLKEESSVNTSLGVVMNLGGLDVTVDYYRVEIKDRISKITEDLNSVLTRRGCLLAGSTPCSLAAIKEELRADVPDINSIGLLSWFANDFDTTTSGLDLVATYPIDMAGGTTLLTLAANWNKTRIDRISEFSPMVDDPFSDRIRIEEGTPDFRASLTADYASGPFRVLGRVRYYGKHIDVYAVDWNVQEMDARTLLDVELSYNLTDSLALVAGADNVLDQEPERLHRRHPDDDFEVGEAFGGLYPENAPFDISGGFYYVKAVLQL